jgi:hypothetical protein
MLAQHEGKLISELLRVRSADAEHSHSEVLGPERPVGKFVVAQGPTSLRSACCSWCPSGRYILHWSSGPGAPTTGVVDATQQERCNRRDNDDARECACQSQGRPEREQPAHARSFPASDTFGLESKLCGLRAGIRRLRLNRRRIPRVPFIQPQRGDDRESISYDLSQGGAREY